MHTRQGTNKGQTWEQKQMAKKKHAQMKEYVQEIKDRRRREIDEKRERRDEQEKRKAQNSIKASKFQVRREGETWITLLHSVCMVYGVWCMVYHAVPRVVVCVCVCELCGGLSKHVCLTWCNDLFLLSFFASSDHPERREAQENEQEAAQAREEDAGRQARRGRDRVPVGGGRAAGGQGQQGQGQEEEIRGRVASSCISKLNVFSHLYRAERNANGAAKQRSEVRVGDERASGVCAERGASKEERVRRGASKDGKAHAGNMIQLGAVASGVYV